MPPHYPLFFLIDPPDRKPLIRPRKSPFPEASRKNRPTAVSPSVFRATPITHGAVQLYPIRMRLKGAPVRLEQTRPAGYPVRFEGRGDGETDGLVRPALVGDDEIGGKRVAPPRDAFDRSVERLQVYRDIRTFSVVGHTPARPFVYFMNAADLTYKTSPASAAAK